MFCAKYAWGLRRACDSHRSGLYSLDVDMADERPTIFAKVQLLLGQADAPGPLYPPSVALQPSSRRNTLNMLLCTRFRKPIGPGSALLPVAISTTHEHFSPRGSQLWLSAAIDPLLVCRFRVISDLHMSLLRCISHTLPWLSLLHDRA